MNFIKIRCKIIKWSKRKLVPTFQSIETCAVSSIYSPDPIDNNPISKTQQRQQSHIYTHKYKEAILTWLYIIQKPNYKQIISSNVLKEYHRIVARLISGHTCIDCFPTGSQIHSCPFLFCSPPTAIPFSSSNTFVSGSLFKFSLWNQQAWYPFSRLYPD